MVVKDYKDVIRILVHPKVKQKMDVYLKRIDNYSRNNDYTYGILITEAWERFKRKTGIATSERAKYELIDVELPYSVFLEIREYANKKGLIELSLLSMFEEVLNETCNKIEIEDYSKEIESKA
jgi:hypothetical protein